MSDPVKNIISFIIAIHRFFEKLDDTHVIEFLADWPPADCRPRPVAPQALPVLSWMPEAVKAAAKEGKSIIQLLVSLRDCLAWGQTYAAEDFGAGFLEKYGWTELIGRRGPVASNHLACGFLFLGPQIEYPRHSHGAEEIYVPLTEQTSWQRGDEDWVRHLPCRPIYHPPGIPHAIRTEDLPLLALYLWRGTNLTEKSHIE
jgi:hypothetical protein